MKLLRDVFNNNSLFKKKDITALIKDAENQPHKLNKTLTSFNLVTLGIGAIIGTGIFVLTGTVAANYAGPALILSFIVSAIGCVFAAFCYAEFASMTPIAGSAYTYAYTTIGEFFAWIIGWDLMLEYLFASATVAVGWSGYVVSFLRDFGIVIPNEFCHAPFDYVKGQGWVQTGAIINLPAIGIIVFVLCLLVIGIKESTTFNNIIVSIKLGVILIFILLGAWYINAENWVPFIPENQGSFGKFGWSGIFMGAGVIFFAYIGFDAVSTAAQETKNPAKSMPIGILGSLAVCTILYVAVAWVLTGVVKYTELNDPAPIAKAIDYMGIEYKKLAGLIKIGAIAGLSSVILVMLMGQSRIFYTMSVDKFFPSFFAKIHPKFKTPYITTIFTCIFSAIIAGLFPINILGELVSIGTLLAFIIVCSSVIVLRKTQPHLPRPFKTPFMPWIPIGGILVCFIQMVSLPADTWLRLIVWLAIGLFLYFFYGRKSING